MTLMLHLLFGSICLVWLGALASARRKRADPAYKLHGTEPGPEAPVRVAVVIPARNEEAHIGACVEAALAQDLDGVKIFVINDGSTDRTGAVLSELASRHPERLVVVSGSDAPLPDGWMGKPWACQRAGLAAIDDHDPDWMLFTDADVRLAPAALTAAVGYADRQQVDLLSGWGQLTMVGFWEKVMQPVVVGMILGGNDMARVNDPERRRGNPIANGQFVLMRADTWRDVGGHGAVRKNVLDDVGMAKAVEGAGHRVQMVFMRPLFSCRMYDSLASLWEGWTKNLFAGMNRSWGTLLAVAGFTAVFTVMPYAVLVLGLAGLVAPTWLAWAAACVLLVQSLRLYLDTTFGSEARYGLTHGPGSFLLVLLLLHSGIKDLRGTATWKGRTIPDQGAA